MFKKAYNTVKNKIVDWLNYEPESTEIMPYDFSRLKYEIKPGDVLLIEGRSRVSAIIRRLTQSTWTHAALYIGRLIDIEDEELRENVQKHADVKDTSRLIIEDLMDKGSTVTSLNFYRHHHIRICRPIGITPADLQLVIKYSIQSLGQPYNVRHIIDMGRFLLPWGILPRRWGSSLFRSSTGKPESGICSSHIAEAFASVQFPVLPFVRPDEQSNLEVLQRNPFLFTPKDFDYSPYFEIIKYPLFNPDEPLPYYRRLPWTKSGDVYQDHGIVKDTSKKKKKRFKLFQKNKTTPDKEDHEE